MTADERLAAPVPDALWLDGSIGGLLPTNASHERQQPRLGRGGTPAAA
jgi:hypothetical protein